MNMIRWLVFFFTISLALSSCMTVRLSITTPVPEKPLSEMKIQPSVGTSGDDSISDEYIPGLGNTGYDARQYYLSMEFSKHLDVITATVTITSAVTMDNLGRISLDFNGYQVDGVQVGIIYASFYRSPDKLYVDLPKALVKGDMLAVRISYHGQVIPVKSPFDPTTPLGLRTIAGKEFTYALAEPDGAHTWFPCNDHPLDKATYQFELTVPKGFTAVANGTLINTNLSGDQDTFFWSEPHPMASYLATVVVGKFRRVNAPAVGNVKIRHYVIEGDFDFSTELGFTQDMLEYYTGLIGPYPFDEFGYIVVLLNFGDLPFGMESQTMVMMSRDMMLNPTAIGALAHEMVHQWFGDSVSLSGWNDIWLNEGFATYLQLMWLDHQGMIDISTIFYGIEESLITPGNMPDQPLNMPSADNMFRANTYGKAPWVLHMLRQQIGEENFTRFLHEYYQQFTGGNASTVDLEKIAEEVSGQDLGWFFQEWVYGTGFPRLDITWTSQRNSVSLQVCQTSSGQVFTLPLEVKMSLGDEQSQNQTIMIDQEQEQASYNLPLQLTGIIADPSQKLLASIAVNKVEQLTDCNP